MRRQEQICGQDHSASSFLSPYHTLKMQEWSILIAAVAQPNYVLTFIIIAGGFCVTRFSQGGLANPAFLKAFPDARWLKSGNHIVLPSDFEVYDPLRSQWPAI